MAKVSVVIEGLTILAKYSDRGLECSGVSAEHDVIYGGEERMGEVSEKDRKRLLELGWHFEEDVQSWARFV